MCEFFGIAPSIRAREPTRWPRPSRALPSLAASAARTKPCLTMYRQSPPAPHGSTWPSWRERRAADVGFCLCTSRKALACRSKSSLGHKHFLMLLACSAILAPSCRRLRLCQERKTLGMADVWNVVGTLWRIVRLYASGTGHMRIAAQLATVCTHVARLRAPKPLRVSMARTAKRCSAMFAAAASSAASARPLSSGTLRRKRSRRAVAECRRQNCARRRAGQGSAP